MGFKMNVKLIGLLLSAFAFLGMLGYIYVLRADIKSMDGEIKGLERFLEEARAEINQCNQDKILSEKVSNDYQKSARSLRNQLNSLRNNPHCIPVSPGPSSGDNGTTAGTKLSGTNGLRAGYLLDFAGSAEETRLKLIGCQNFVNQLYESRIK